MVSGMYLSMSLLPVLHKTPHFSDLSLATALLVFEVQLSVWENGCLQFCKKQFMSYLACGLPWPPDLLQLQLCKVHTASLDSCSFPSLSWLRTWFHNWGLIPIPVPYLGMTWILSTMILVFGEGQAEGKPWKVKIPDGKVVTWVNPKAEIRADLEDWSSLRTEGQAQVEKGIEPARVNCEYLISPSFSS